MKTILIFLLLSASVAAQSVIQKIDGSTIAIDGTVKPDFSRNKLFYKEQGSGKKKKIKFKDVEYATFEGYFFRTFVVDGKRRGFYVFADRHGKSVAVAIEKKSKNTGGFMSYYNRYDVAITQNGDVQQIIRFTNSNQKDNPELRKQAKEMILREFADCQLLVDRFVSNDVMQWFENLRQINCN